MTGTTRRDVRSAAKDARRTAKLEAKIAKEETRQAKQATKAARGEQKEAEKAAKREAKAARKGEHGRFTPGTARKVVGVAKVLGPAVAPYVWQACSAVRDGYDRARAHRLGIDVDDLSRFSGKGAALHARIAGDAETLRDLRTRTAGRPTEEIATIEQFGERAQARLEQLASAVRAAERMPAPRRRTAHRAVLAELDRIEDDLLHRLGIGTLPSRGEPQALE